MSKEDSSIESFEYVKFFLKKLQHLLNDNTCQLDIQRSRKGQDNCDPNTTTNTMHALEYNSEDIREELLSLKTGDYIKTVRDRKRTESSDYWIFSKKVRGRDIYIKLKIYSVNKIHLMSFHYAVFGIEDKPYK